ARQSWPLLCRCWWYSALFTRKPYALPALSAFITGAGAPPPARTDADASPADSHVCRRRMAAGAGFSSRSSSSIASIRPETSTFRTIACDRKRECRRGDLFREAQSAQRSFAPQARSVHLSDPAPAPGSRELAEPFL